MGTLSSSAVVMLPLTSDVNIAGISTVLKDIVRCILFNLTAVQTRLSYWQIKHDRLDTTWNSASLGDYRPPGRIYLQGKQSEVAIRVLMKLRYALCVFLSKVFTELETGRDAHDVPRIINHLDTHFNAFSESVTSTGLGPLAFARLAELDQSAILPDAGILSQIYNNLSSIDSYLLTQISRYEKPKSWISGKWGYFALIGAIGISIATKCLMPRKSNELSFLEAVRNFLQEHVKKPIRVIRNEFYARPEENEDNRVQEASNSLQSMVAKFVNVESTANTPEKEIVELAERRVINLYNRPNRSFVNGAFIQAVMIRVQKIYVDYETGNFEITGFYKSNKVNLALLSAIPAYFASKGIIWTADKFWKGTMQVIERDRTQSKMLLITVRIVMTEFVEHPPEEPRRQYLHGLLLYLLDKFCMRIKKHAMLRAEWERVRQDVIEVSRFNNASLQKEEAIHRLRKYKCTHA